MRGVVIETGQEYFSFLSGIFLAIGNAQKNYNWLITPYECYPRTKEYKEKMSGEYCWVLGEDLTSMVECEDFQWIWWTFSGFNRNLAREDVLKYKFPRADGYTKIWTLPVPIQHPLAEIEIIAWDSSLTVFISKEDKLVFKIMENYLLAQDLEEYNQ